MMNAPILMPFQELPFNADRYICQEFIKLKEKYNLNVAVETGSCLYSTTKWLGENFDSVHTVELSQEYSNFGIHKVSNMPNVYPKIGDSVTFLQNLTNVLTPNDKCIFFLDAHWGENCPLLQELEALTKFKTNLPPIIAIHDFYTGDEKFGWDEYGGQRFDYEWIKPQVKELEKAHNCTYLHYYNTEAENGMRGVIYLVPLKHWVHQIKNVTKWNKYSQSGEESYVDFILKNLPSKGNHLVEIGAWDGRHLSNTRHLIENGFTHLLIDGDNRGNEEVKEHFVTKDNILDILSQYDTPSEFDLLCIDIDGNDIYVLETILSKYSPSLIVAEYNPIWQPEESKAIKYDEKHTWSNDDYYGFSFLAGLKLANKFGYKCVFENDSLNMYFVKEDMLEGISPDVTYKPTNYHNKSLKTTWVDYE